MEITALLATHFRDKLTLRWSVSSGYFFFFFSGLTLGKS